MDLKQIVMLAIQVSILCIVLGFGMRATFADLLYVLRRPGLLVRSILAVFVMMPVVAVILTRMFEFRPAVEIALIALSISPLPPLLLKKQIKSGGHASFGLGLMAILALLSIVAAPLALEILERVFGRPLSIEPGTVASVIVKSVLAPLLGGMVIRAVFPAISERLERSLTIVGKVLLTVGLLILLAVTLPAVGQLIGNGTILAIVVFTVAGLTIGHFLGGPDQNDSIVLALATACRHPAIALTVAGPNFPDRQFGGTILLCLLVNAIATIPYLALQKRKTTGAMPVLSQERRM
jgi:BASS family bile acid:Na+ symporter